MPVELHGPHVRPLSTSSAGAFIGRICEDPGLDDSRRATEILLVRGASPVSRLPPGFRAYLLEADPGPPAGDLRDVYFLASAMRYLGRGDVVGIDPRRHSLRALYRRSSPSNAFLVTERCDNHCVMCSQPPRTRDDTYLVDELEEVIPLVSPDTEALGITGGEPALLGERLPQLLERMKHHLPRTAVHVLSNGRRFADPAFARRLGAIEHPDLMLGIPLYSDLPEAHDFVVQAQGAFAETIRGILNLKRFRVRVEIRFVIQAATFERLPDFARFLARNLLFADHVALMGLELMGFARTNLEAVWIDPLDYQELLVEAVDILARAGMNVSLYNHQLCVLDTGLHRFARKSISDWKNIFHEECEGCASRASCGGFFASSTLRKSRGIRPIPLDAGPSAPHRVE